MAKERRLTKEKSIPVGAVLAALGIHALWGANPVAVKLGLEAFPPLTSGFLRFAIGCLCVYAWANVMRVPILPGQGEWPWLLLIGLVFTAQIALMNVGLDKTTATNGAVLISTNPLFGVLFAHLLVPGDRVGIRRAFGVAIAFAGVALVLTRCGGLATSVAKGGDLVVLLSACLLGLRLALSGRLLQHGNEVRLTFWQMATSLPLFAVGAIAWEEIRWEQIGIAPVGGILYQGIVVAGLAFTVNFYLMRRFNPSVIISFNFVAPVAGVLLGVAVLGEHLSTGLLGGMALVALGLVFITRSRP